MNCCSALKTAAKPKVATSHAIEPVACTSIGGIGGPHSARDGSDSRAKMKRHVCTRMLLVSGTVGAEVMTVGIAGMAKPAEMARRSTMIKKITESTTRSGVMSIIAGAAIIGESAGAQAWPTAGMVSSAAR